MSLPWWVEEKEKCMWCYCYASLDSAFVTEDEKAVRTIYKCSNEECKYLELDHGPNTFSFVHAGKHAVDVFLKRANNESLDSSLE